MTLDYSIRGYVGAAAEAHLNGSIGTSDAAFTLQAGEGTGWSTANFGIIVDYDNGSAEKMYVGSRSGVNLSGIARAQDDTTAKAHSTGAKIRHVAFKQDFVEANAVAAALTTKGDSLWKGGVAAVAPARLAAGLDQQIIRYLAANSLGVETTWKGAVPIFATTTARDAAITSPSSGQAVYIDSGDAAEGLYFYNGTSWRPVAWNAPWGEIAYAEATGAQSGISSVTDVTSATVTFTAVTGRKYTTIAQATFSQNVAQGNVALSLADGSNTIVQQPAMTVGAGTFGQLTIHKRETITAGSVTRKMRIQTTAGTVTLNQGAGNPTTIQVLDSGPSGTPT